MKQTLKKWKLLGLFLLPFRYCSPSVKEDFLEELLEEILAQKQRPYKVSAVPIVVVILIFKNRLSRYLLLKERKKVGRAGVPAGRESWEVSPYAKPLLHGLASRSTSEEPRLAGSR